MSTKTQSFLEDMEHIDLLSKKMIKTEHELPGVSGFCEQKDKLCLYQTQSNSTSCRQLILV